MPEPLRPISATTSPRDAGEVDATERDHVAVAHHQTVGVEDRRGARSSAAPARARRPTGSRSEATCRRASRTDRGSGSQPASRPRRTTGGASSEVRNPAAGVVWTAPPSTVEDDDVVGVLHHPLEAVLGHHDRDPEVVHQPVDGGQHVLGGGGVERGGGLVEHEDARVGREHRADGDALLLPAGERAQRAIAELGDAEQVERLLDPLAHHRRRDGELLHRVGELLLHRVGDEPGQRVLPHHAHDVGEVSRGVGAGVATVDGDPARRGGRR